MLVFKKIYKCSISAVEIRRFYCTYLKYEVKNGHMTEDQHREIAEMLEIEESTSRSQYTRAKQMLEDVLIKKNIIQKPQIQNDWVRVAAGR